jgi:hypothetical protein
MLPSTPENIFYNNVPAAVTQLAVKELKIEAITLVITCVSAPAWPAGVFRGRLAYVRTALDNSIPASLRDAWLQDSGVE